VNRDLEGGGDQRISLRAGAGPPSEHGPVVEALVPPAAGCTTDGVGQGFGHLDLRRWADGKPAGIEGDVVAVAGPQAVSGIHALAEGAVYHALIYPAISMCLAPNGKGFRPQKTHRCPPLLSTFRANTCCPTGPPPG
jgi:hypothetical protein